MGYRLASIAEMTEVRMLTGTETPGSGLEAALQFAGTLLADLPGCWNQLDGSIDQGL